MFQDRTYSDFENISNLPKGQRSIHLGGLVKIAPVPTYHGTAYGGLLNQALRFHSPLSPEFIDTINNMDCRMQYTMSDIVLDREVNTNYLKDMGLSLDSLKDKAFRDDGYVSATYKPCDNSSLYSFYGGDPVFMKLLVPQGTPAMLVDDEYEVTLSRGLKYHIDSARTDDDNQLHLVVSVSK